MKKGMLWPDSVAPVQLHLISVGADRSPEVKEAAELFYRDCLNRGIDVLYDDRDERPGVKFSDADLIGIPHKVVIGKRSLEANLYEYTRRRGETEGLAPNDIL